MADPHQNSQNFALYTDANGEVRVEAFVQDETIWLSQKSMAELFNFGVPAVASI